MERKITADLLKWSMNPRRKPLIIKGCRQVGKTHSVEEFAKEHYRSYVLIDFEKDPGKRRLFAGSLDPKVLVPNILISEGTELHEGESLIIFDEVHLCSGAYSSLKHFAEDGRFDVIAISSFFDTVWDDDDRLSPMGYVDFLEMRPMDFEEYLWAMGVRKELIDIVRGSIREMKPVDGYFHASISEHFRRYLVVGGMPEAVRTYAETSDYIRTSKALGRITGTIRGDVRDRSRKAGYSKLGVCFDSIPRQLSRGDKRFRFSDIEGRRNTGFRTYGAPVHWLIGAGLALQCRNLREPTAPSSMYASDRSFKLYMTDTGVLAKLMGADATEVVFGDPFACGGALMENAVACALSAKGYDLYFYAKEGSTLKVDFVSRIGGCMSFIEVKSGENRRSKALSSIMLGREDGIGFRIMDSNVEYDEKNGIWHLPLYAVCFLSDFEMPNIPPSPSSEEINRAFDEYMKNRDGKDRSGPPQHP